jgi:hypothetical protein
MKICVFMWPPVSKTLWYGGTGKFLEHFPYSPGISPHDFALFPKIKELLQGK